MLKSVKYNSTYREIRKKRTHTAYTQEENLISDFEFELDKKNICLEYGDKREARNARGALTRYVKATEKKLDVKQRENFVFVVKEEADEQN